MPLEDLFWSNHHLTYYYMWAHRKIISLSLVLNMYFKYLNIFISNLDFASAKFKWGKMLLETEIGIARSSNQTCVKVC